MFSVPFPRLSLLRCPLTQHSRQFFRHFVISSVIPAKNVSLKGLILTLFGGTNNKIGE